jgi:hypothetical protein
MLSVIRITVNIVAAVRSPQLANPSFPLQNQAINTVAAYDLSRRKLFNRDFQENFALVHAEKIMAPNGAII